MYTTTVASIKDYQLCARLYDYRYNLNLSEPVLGRDLLSTRYENTLKKVVTFFFYKKQGGITPSYNALLNRWERLWFPKDMTAFDMASEQHASWHGNLASFSNAAAASLLQFHEDFAEINADPIMIDEKFFIPLSKTVRLEGVVDLMLRSKSGTHIIKWSASQKRPSISGLLLDFAALRAAIEYKTRTNATYSIYDVGSAKPGIIGMSPKKQDVNALSFWAHDLAEAEVLVPRRGLTAYCKSCPFDEPCALWNEWPNRENDLELISE